MFNQLFYIFKWFYQNCIEGIAMNLVWFGSGAGSYSPSASGIATTFILI